MAQTRVLMVLTSNPRFGMHGGATGLAFDTFAAPFYAFEDAGMSAEIATIRGGEPPFAPNTPETDATKRARGDARLMEGLRQAPALRQVQTSLYDAVFLSGGHGAAWDFPACPELTVALEQFALQGKPIAAVGHGAAALVPVMDRRSQPLTRGRTVACPSIAEDKEAGVDGVLPFQIEAKLRDLGALIEPAEPFAEKVAIDEFLITGQNAASAAGVAEALIQAVRGARIAA